MRRSLPVALAVIVVALGLTPARALFGHDCTGGPGSSPFDPIERRLSTLLDTTGATPELGEPWSSLDRASGNAGDCVAAAHGICSFGKTHSARRRLQRAKTLLDRYAARLRGSAAQAIPPEVRDPLLTEAVAIAAEVVALHARLDCPIDA